MNKDETQDKIAVMLQEVDPSTNTVQRRDLRKMVAAYRCAASSTDEESFCTHFSPNGNGCKHVYTDMGLKACAYTGIV